MSEEADDIVEHLQKKAKLVQKILVISRTKEETSKT